MSCQRGRSNSKHSHAFTYSPADHKLAIEDIKDSNETRNSLKVALPRFRNKVDIYADDVSKKGFIASVRLDHVGFTKSMERRLGRDYTVLHVKGGKLNPPW